MSREQVETIVRAEFTHEPGADEIVSAIVDGAYREDDRDWIAADLWAMGAGASHEGCIYGPPEPADGYENACETCETHLLAVADRIIAAVHEPTDPGSGL